MRSASHTPFGPASASLRTLYQATNHLAARDSNNDSVRRSLRSPSWHTELFRMGLLANADHEA